MKTVNDIRVVLYDFSERETSLVKKFLDLENPEKIAFQTEDDLGVKIELIRKKFKSKEVVILKRFLGRFFQMCPGSPGMICCNYRLINTGFNCLYDCTYCYLQSYLNSFGIVVFTNMPDVISEIDRFLGSEMDREKVYRIGTGEFTDSLMIEEITGFGMLLVEKLSKFRNVFLELKTKSSNIDPLLKIHEKGNAVIAWSLNTERNIMKYEKDSASIDSRISAARAASKSGYYCAFHFDPIIVYDGWKDDYAAVIKMVFDSVTDSSIVWISLGGVRFTAEFPDIMKNNFPDERITEEEFFPASDGKLRYFKPFRKEVYKFFRSEILKYSDYSYVYMCMETGYMWQDVFGRDFMSSEDMENDFAMHLMNRFVKPE